MTTTDTTTELDRIRRQRDHAEAEVHRLSAMLNNPDLLAALVLLGKVLDAWQHHTLRSEVRNVAPELAHALDALQAGPDGQQAAATSADTNRHGLGVWCGDDWTVEQLPNGDVQVSVSDHRDPPGGQTYTFEPDLAAAIGAAAAAGLVTHA